MKQEKITYEEFCAKHGVDTNALPDVSSFPEKDHKYYLALFKWDVIRKCLNGDKKLCPADASQNKYEPFVWLVEDANHPSGFGFSIAGHVCTSTYSYVCARLRFIDPDDTLFALENFKDIFLDIVIEY